MKTLLSIAAGIAVFIAILGLDRYVIDLILVHITEDWKVLVRVILWILAGIWTFGLTIWAAILIASLVRIILGE